MRNGQLKPAYNVQIGVESEYIVGVGLFPNPNDTGTFIPFLNRVQTGCGRRYENIVADASYASEENYTYLENQGQGAYIKPQNYEISKKKKYKNNPYRVENMPYDAENDRFTCPNGKHLNFAGESSKKTDNGYEQKKKNYICESCAGCPHREKCFKGKYENRKIEFSPEATRFKGVLNKSDAQATEEIFCPAKRKFAGIPAVFQEFSTQSGRKIHRWIV